MAYDGWVKFDDVELINLSRTTQLAQAMGIEGLWLNPDDLDWIEHSLGGGGYSDVSEAPWYDPGYAPSSEFAGIVPLSLAGLGDSTLESTPVEYITDGGNPGRSRNATLPIVANVVLVASTARGAEYGLRWMNSVLRRGGSGCSGADLRYFRYQGSDSPQAYHRNVKLTRGSSVTRRRNNDCSALWMVTFTLTAGDPYEYGDAQLVVTGLGVVGAATGASITAQGSLVLTQLDCPQFDYTPIYDPLYPAMVAAPDAPDFYPDGWDVAIGSTFERFWARISPLEPSTLNAVPVIKVYTEGVARMVRVGIWPGSAELDDQCGDQFAAVATYIPDDYDLYIDGVQRACYFWDGGSGVVRRGDTVVFGQDARPIDWSTISDVDGLLVCVDIFSDSDSEATSVKADFSFAPKSD